VRATGEASSPQKITFKHIKTIPYISSLFSFFVGLFGPSESGSRSSRPKPMLIRVNNTVQNNTFLHCFHVLWFIFAHPHMDADPDPASKIKADGPDPDTGSSPPPLPSYHSRYVQSLLSTESVSFSSLYRK
jgi:hypothetical protein